MEKYMSLLQFYPIQHFTEAFLIPRVPLHFCFDLNEAN